MRRGIVIGGGAAGLMAAIAAAEAGADVTVLEHMPRVGKKLLSTGNGKCNLTNIRMSGEAYRCGEPDFPLQVIGTFPVAETLAFFRRLGVLTTDRAGYVYPASGQAQTVLDALRERADSLGIRIVCECGVERIAAREARKAAETGKGQWQEQTGEAGRFAVHTDLGVFRGDFLILAAGGMAARFTGSDGSGYALARSLGHRIKKPLPALVQLRCGGGFFKSAAGVRTPARVTLLAGREAQTPTLLAEDTGELQLTDYGISGIPVFQVSRYAAKALDGKFSVTAVLNFYPRASAEELFAELQRQRDFLAGRPAAGFLNGFFHKKLAALLLKEAGIPGQAAVEGLSDRQLRRLAERIQSFSVPVTGTNPFEQAQVCMGGVRTEDVDPATMESRLVPGLYFAGEILDVDGICGGYNLQWAWSSGHLAGVSAGRGTGAAAAADARTAAAADMRAAAAQIRGQLKRQM